LIVDGAKNRLCFCFCSGNGFCIGDRIRSERFGCWFPRVSRQTVPTILIPSRVLPCSKPTKLLSLTACQFEFGQKIGLIGDAFEAGLQDVTA
jgi:hypothetical protein